MGHPVKLKSWRGRGAGGPDLSPNLVACRWEAPRSWVQNSLHMLCFCRDELDSMCDNQLVWVPYFRRILRDYPYALQESELCKLLHC